mmetsp:Transcript_60928/g.122145  ORF Transcript_60928/g.122145 Transcript_60928/m.122145 type:complete len:244 (+) Transcript_60928:118-849(+)
MCSVNLALFDSGSRGLSDRRIGSNTAFGFGKQADFVADASARMRTPSPDDSYWESAEAIRHGPLLTPEVALLLLAPPRYPSAQRALPALAPPWSPAAQSGRPQPGGAEGPPEENVGGVRGECRKGEPQEEAASGEVSTAGSEGTGVPSEELADSNKSQDAASDEVASEGAEWPSCGSVGHPHACAMACKYVLKPRGCKDGSSCNRCHLCKWSSPRPPLSDNKAGHRRRRRAAAARQVGAAPGA